MPSQKSTFGRSITNWYEINKRDLPWRKSSDPFKIWLSEIILQQTRVEQGLPYYLRFTDRFQNIGELAAASEEEVLRIWQGLGYYSRARNLHACAKLLVKERKGAFPGTYDELIKLPGIGPYTAAAIASIAFGEPVPTIDGNVFRVLGRVLGITSNIYEQKTRAEFFQVALELMEGHPPEIFNQGVMEFGALQCVPKNPDCEDCILNSFCYAYLNKAQADLPVKIKQARITERYFNYVVFMNSDKILMRKRKAGDIWQGLYDFDVIESEQLLSEEEVIRGLSDVSSKITVNSISTTYKHILSHQRIYARFFTIELNEFNFVQSIAKKKALRVLSRTELMDIPKPRLLDRFLRDENFI